MLVWEESNIFPIIQMQSIFLVIGISDYKPLKYNERKPPNLVPWFSPPLLGQLIRKALKTIRQKQNSQEMVEFQLLA